MGPTVPQLLEKLRAGDEPALDEMVRLLYNELHRIAARQLRSERAAHTLQATALVNEAYLKLIADTERAFADRAHFLAIASRVMRQILVDYARARATKKRACTEAHIPSPESTYSLQIEEHSGAALIELLDLDRALKALAREDQSLARLIEMRYFGGMTAEETAEVLGQSVNVVRHDLRFAQAWLRSKLRGS